VYKLIYPKKDATIYELHPNRNSGIDQILDLTKFSIGEQYDDVSDINAAWDKNYNSRILIQFDLTELQAEIAAGNINTGSAKYYLRLYSSDATSLQTEYTLHAYPLSQPWTNGNGNYNDEPEIRNGVSWYYRNGYQVDTWDSGSGSFQFASVSGGGTWNSNYEATQSFSFQSPDLRMDITPIVRQWVSGSIPNHGLILKHSQTAETDDQIYGSIKFFSRETHTIYIPTLEVYWDSGNNYTGSFNSKTEVSESFTIFTRNLKNKYSTNEIVKLRIGVRDTYPSYAYVMESENTIEKKFPITSYYSVVDYVTGIDVVPFDTIGTKIQMDDRGHFINLSMKNLLPIRYYKILIKVVDSDGNETVLDSNINFKVEKYI
jgi:hypothetical protein